MEKLKKGLVIVQQDEISCLLWNGILSTYVAAIIAINRIILPRWAILLLQLFSRIYVKRVTRSWIQSFNDSGEKSGFITIAGGKKIVE